MGVMDRKKNTTMVGITKMLAELSVPTSYVGFGRDIFRVS